MKPRVFTCLLTVAVAFGCSHTIPPPVRAPSPASKPDEHLAKENPANADPNLKPPFGPFDVQTVFYISKSNDKDRVDYGMRLDEYCSPVGDDAVFPYWRIFEKGPPVRSHPLKFLQYVAYGVSEQRALERNHNGGKYYVRLKQVNRPITIVTKQDQEGHCISTAYSKIQDVDGARLEYIFAKVAGMTSVDYVEVHGTDEKTNRSLLERLTP